MLGRRNAAVNNSRAWARAADAPYQQYSRGAAGWSKPPSPSRVHTYTLPLARAAPGPFSIKRRDAVTAISFPSCLLCPCQHVARRRQRSKVTKIKPAPYFTLKSIAHLRESNSLSTCCSIVTILKSNCFGCQCRVVQISELFDEFCFANLHLCNVGKSERLKMKEHQVRCSWMWLIREAWWNRVLRLRCKWVQSRAIINVPSLCSNVVLFVQRCAHRAYRNRTVDINKSESFIAHIGQNLSTLDITNLTMLQILIYYKY